MIDYQKSHQKTVTKRSRNQTYTNERFGMDLGSILGTKIGPKSIQNDVEGMLKSNLQTSSSRMIE